MRAAVAEAMEGQKQVETIADGPDGPVKTYTDGTTEAVIVHGATDLPGEEDAD